MVTLCRWILRFAYWVGFRRWVAHTATHLANIGRDLGTEAVQTRLVRASAEVHKIGDRLSIDGRDFYVTRLLSASKREVIYEAQTR